MATRRGEPWRLPWLTPLAACCLMTLGLVARPADAATLTWGTSGTGGSGTWTAANGWWSGTGQQNWSNATPDDAIFGGGAGDLGGTVALTGGTTTAASMAFNTFTGTYTIGTASQTLAVNGGGITLNAGAGAVTIQNSPITLGAAQTWTNNSASLLTVSSGITNGGNLLTVAGSGNSTLAGAIAGLGGLTKSGNGTLTLSASNSYSGSTTVNGGVIASSARRSFGTGTISIDSAASVRLTGSNSGTNSFAPAYYSDGYQNAVTGSGVLELVGQSALWSVNYSGDLSGFTGTLSATAASTTYVGVGSVSNPSLNLTGTNTRFMVSGAVIMLPMLETSGTIAMGELSGNGTITSPFQRNATYVVGHLATSSTFSGAIGQNSALTSLVKVGSGTLTLAGNSTYSGGTQLNAGALVVGSSAGLGTGTVALNGGLLQSGFAGTLATPIAIIATSGTFDSQANTTTQSGTISGTGNFVKVGSGTLTLSASNSFTGTTRIAAGTLTLGNASALSASMLDMNAADAGSVSFNQNSTIAGLTGSRNLDMSGRTLTVGGNGQSTTYSGSLSNGGLTKTGTGTLTLSGGLGFTGSLTVNRGTVAVSNAASVGALVIGGSAAAAPTVSISSGTLRFGVSGIANDVIGASAGERGILEISGSATIANSNNSASLFYVGASGAGVVRQSGGTATWGGSGSATGGFATARNANSYGAYVISNGTMTTSGTNQWFAIGNGGNGLFQQTGGSVTATAAQQGVAFGLGSGGYGVADFSGGSFSTPSMFQIGSTGTGATGVITIRGGAVQLGGILNVTGTDNASTGIVNLLSGTLEANRITKVTSGTAKATFNADGGTLKVNATNSGTNFFSGLDNAFIRSGGLTFDTAGQNVTIAQVLSAPAGHGVLASGSTLAVASGGSGYLAPPLVTFSTPSGGGVAATGLATIDANGKVTGITITSAGSGYSSGETVTITYNGGSNASGAAVSEAPSFTTTASQLNASGGFFKLGSGTLTLSGSNTYTGQTRVSAGVLALGAANAVSNQSGLLVDGGGFNLAGFNETVASVTLTSGSIFGAGTLTSGSDYDLRSGAVTSNLGGSVGLVKSTSGTVMLSASNTYSGPTTVSNGLIVGSNLNSFSSGTVTIGASGTMRVTAWNGATLTSANAYYANGTLNTVTGSGVLELMGQSTGYGVNYSGDLSGFTGTVSATSAAGFFVGVGNTASEAIRLSGSNTRFVVSGPGTLLPVTGTSGATLATISLGELSGDGVVAAKFGVDSTWQVGGLSTSSTFTGQFVNNLNGGVGRLSLVKVGSGTLALTGSQGYIGTTTISGGRLAVTGNGVLGGGNYAGAIANAGELFLGSDVAQILSGTISGSGSLLKDGAGTLTLSASNAFSGGLTVTNGLVVGSNRNAFGSGTVAIGATGTVQMTALAATSFSNGMTNAVSGSGVLRLVGSSSTSSVNYSGNLSAFRGTVSATSTAGAFVAVGDAANASFLSGSSAVFDVTGAGFFYPLSTSNSSGTFAMGGLLGSGIILNRVTSTSTLRIGDLAMSSTFSGILQNNAGGGILALTKVGAGTLELTGSSSYTGPTAVEAGVLAVNGRLGNSALTVFQGASLMGSGTIAGLTTIAGMHLPGNSPGVETFTNGLGYASTGRLVWDLWDNTVLSRGTAYDGVDITGGALTIDPAATLELVFGTTALGSTVDWSNAFWASDRQWTIIDVSGGATWNGNLFGPLMVGTDAIGQSLNSVRGGASFSVAQSGGDLVLIYAAVPEPGTLALAGIGIGVAGWAASSRSRRRAS